MAAKDIRIHGRGGQGVVTAGELLARAAFEDGKWAQAFPEFGSERVGSPVRAYVRISDGRVRSRSSIVHPDYIIVQDATLLSANILEGLKPKGLVIVNWDRPPEELGLPDGVVAVLVPATAIARRVLGRPLPNTSLMGAFAAATGEVSLEAVGKALATRFGKAQGEKNLEAATEAFRWVKEKRNGDPDRRGGQSGNQSGK
jgi:pyruvate ferredoxin oxidoreductase gamma subunit